MDAMHGCDTVEGTRLLRQVKALGFLGFKVIRRKKNNMMDTQSKNKVLFIMLLVMSFHHHRHHHHHHHHHQRYIFAMSFFRLILGSIYQSLGFGAVFPGARLASGSSTTEVGTKW